MNAMRLRIQDPDSPPSAEALRLFTIGAADALGMGAEIGSPEAGKRVDLIMLDIDRTHMQPFHGAYPALLWHAKSSDVAASVIDGRVVLRDGQPVFAPQAEIMADLARRAWRRDGDRVS
jgi:5-methylthioadenosine/S-adenosylhomocysteine deaminase